MALSLEEVQHVARLARLELTSDEAQLYQRQLSAVLEAVGQLAALDTTAVEATSHATMLGLSLRADEVRPSLPPEEGLRNAPARSGTSFAVPKIIE